MRDAALDLILGSSCVGCRRPGRMLCPDCRAGLPTGAWPAWPTPTPAGLVVPWAAAEYAGGVARMVSGHKDHHQLGFRRVLGGLLATAVSAAVQHLPSGDAVVLVAVPSRPGSVRRRGYDPTGALVRTAAGILVRRGRDVLAAPVLTSRGGVADQAGLSTTARAANVAGSMCCHGARLRRLARRREAVHVVVCDDVITTGATALEAQRALTAVGLPPIAVAAVAATRRRRPGAADHSRGSLSSVDGTG